MARASGGPPDTKPWVSPRAIWAVCLFNREFSLQETGPGRGVDACWLLGSIQPTGPITAGPCGRRRRHGRFRKRWHFGNAGPDTCAACLRTGTRHECRNCGRRDRLTSDRCMTPGEALPENPTLRVNRAVPAFGAEIFESTCSTVQQHTPRYLCSTKYHTPIHGAPRAPLQSEGHCRQRMHVISEGKIIPVGLADVGSLPPLRTRHVRPRYCAVQ